MKARQLQKALNTTRTIADYGDYIGVGSSMIHNIISVDKSKLKVTYCMAGHWEDPAPRDPELRAIYDKLKAMCESGEIHEYLAGEDAVENQMPIFWEQNGEIIESVTEQFDVLDRIQATKEGLPIYSNTHFKNRQGAILCGIKHHEACIELATENLKDLEEKLNRLRERIESHKKHAESLRKMESQP